MSSTTAIRNPESVSYAGAFMGLMLRDLRVLQRELGPFVVRIGMQPLLFLFVFTFLFARLSDSANRVPAAPGEPARYSARPRLNVS